MGGGLEPADKILIWATFCWPRGCSRAARTKRKATLSEMGHTLCFGFDSLHLFAITLPLLLQEKAFSGACHPAVLSQPSAWITPSRSSAAAVAKAQWWAHRCGKGRNSFQNKAQHSRPVKCSHAAACLQACAWGALRCSFFSPFRFVWGFFLRCSVAEWY